MTVLSVSHVKIAGIAAAVPENIKNIETDQCFFPEESLQKIAQSTGVLNRHVVSLQTCTSDLCLSAASELIKKLNWKAEEIDALIFISQTPDYVLPATACVLHGKLKLSPHCIAFDVNLGCSGYVYGLYILGQLLESGKIKKGLLLVGDTISKLASQQDRSVYPLFGDAGTATALIYQEQAELMFFSLGTDGSGADYLKVPAGGFREPKSLVTSQVQEDAQGNLRSREDLWMDGSEVFAFTLRAIPNALKNLLITAGESLADIDIFIFHQANKFMLDYLQKKSGIPSEKFLISLDQYGNTSSASIPLAMVHRKDQIKKNKNQKLLLAGFGVGFSWALATVNLASDVLLLDVINYQNPEQKLEIEKLERLEKKECQRVSESI